MARYEVTLRDRSTELVAGADAYQQEGQMTTFFQTASARQVVDTWSTRVASFRTSEVLMIRRTEDGMGVEAVDRTDPAPLDEVGTRGLLCEDLDPFEVRESSPDDGVVRPMVRTA